MISTGKIDREALACAAGFFNGEGSTAGTGTGLGKYLKRNGIRMSIGQRTLWELEQFRSAVGMGLINGPYKRKTGGDLYFYRLNGWRNVQAVIAMLWPWLSPSKRAQAKLHLIRYRDWTRSHPNPKRLR